MVPSYNKPQVTKHWRCHTERLCVSGFSTVTWDILPLLRWHKQVCHECHFGTVCGPVAHFRWHSWRARCRHRPATGLCSPQHTVRWSGAITYAPASLSSSRFPVFAVFSGIRLVCYNLARVHRGFEGGSRLCKKPGQPSSHNDTRGFRILLGFVHLPSVLAPYLHAWEGGGYGAKTEGRWRDTAFSILRKASVKDVIYQTGALIERSIAPFHRKQRRGPFPAQVREQT
jgi:hypothetical protein